MSKYKPVILIILDGWGISPSWGGNALAVYPPKNINRLWRDYPHKVLQAFTLLAGKYGVVGDSRLGHSTIAAGRRIVQDLEVISESIADKSFYKNKVLRAAIDRARQNKSNLHLIGLLSSGGIHSHISHLEALLELCYRQDFDRVFIDAILDGIDSGEFDGLGFVEKIKRKILECGIGEFSSIIGRSFAMDRLGDQKKTFQAVELFTAATAPKFSTAAEAVSAGYKNGFTDFTLPGRIVNTREGTMSVTKDDVLIFFNFRGDRSQGLVKAVRQALQNPHVVTFTRYSEDLTVEVAFPPKEIKETLGEILAKNQKRQLHLAEQEKQAHVTSFFDCRAWPYDGEEIQIVPSRRVSVLKNPRMATPRLAELAVKAIKSRRYDFILLNLANVDAVSHTGDIMAARTAIATVDEAVAKIVTENLCAKGATIITADHGNIEQMRKVNARQDPETKHTLNPVPFILVTADNKRNLVKSALTFPSHSLSKIITATDTLTDVAPTVCELLGVPRSDLMTGHSLINRLE